MVQDEKNQLIKDNKDAAIAALNSVLDNIYELNEKFFDENGQLIPDLTYDEKAKDFIIEIRKDAPKYEKLRRKMIDDDFNLSLAETARIGLAFMYMHLTIEKQINLLTQVDQKSKDIMSKLINSDNEIIDFSQE